MWKTMELVAICRSSARSTVSRLHQRRGEGNERGTTLVEFALLMPMLVVLLSGVLELGRALDIWLVVTNATREGGRYASLSGRNPPMYANDIQSVTYNYLVKGFAGRTDVEVPPASSVQVTGVPFCYESKKGGCPAPAAPGAKATVAVTVNMPIYIPLVQSFFPSNPTPISGKIAVEVQ